MGCVPRYSASNGGIPNPSYLDGCTRNFAVLISLNNRSSEILPVNSTFSYAFSSSFKPVKKLSFSPIIFNVKPSTPENADSRVLIPLCFFTLPT